MAFFIAQTLKSLMERKGLSSHELAKEIGVKQPIIHRLISGQNINPTISTLAPIAKYFNITISQLLGENAFSKNFQGKTSADINDWEAVPVLDTLDLNTFPNWANPKKWLFIDTKLSDKAFAMNVLDENMEPSIPKFATVVVEPLLEPESKDFILIQENEVLRVKYYLRKEKNKFTISKLNNIETVEPFIPSKKNILIGTIVRVFFGRNSD